MFDHLLPHLEDLGIWIYWIVLLAALIESTAFVGLFFPGTTLVTFVGYLASRHVLDVGDAIWFVAIGGIVGDAVSFELGRRGKNFFTPGSKYFKPELLQKGHNFFNHHGAKSVFFARFVGPLRPIVPFVAGLSKMDSKRFFLYNIIGGVVAAAVYIGIGYFFGNVWHTYRHVFRRFEPLLVLGIISFVGWYWWKKRIK